MKKLLLKNKAYLVVILLLIIAEPAIASVLNFWLQQLFASARIGAEKLAILRLLTIGFLLWSVKRIISFAVGIFRAKYVCSCKEDVKNALFKSVVGIDTANITVESSGGEYISIFTNDINILETRFFTQILSLVSNIFSIAILGSSFFALNKTLALSILAFGCVTMFIPALFSNSLNKKNLKYSDDVSELTQVLKEYIAAYPTIKNYSIEGKVLQKFKLKNLQTEGSKYAYDYTLNLANGVGALLSWFMQFIAVGIGIMLVIKGEIILGTVVAAQGFAGDLAMPLQNIVGNFNSIYSVKQISKKLSSMCAFEDEQKPDFHSCSDNKGEQCDYTLKFQGLHIEFADKVIIKDFSFNFQENKKYLIVGANGSGKSTVFKATKKWFPCYSGEIFIGERNIKDIPSSKLSKLVSYLNENVSIFSGSVAQNITLFSAFTPQQLQSVTEKARVNLELSRIIKDDGRNISSGEQRRIEIARSLLRDAKIIVFDEVVSTLDIKTAYEIEKAALGFGDKTVIFISHNFSGKLISEYDEILLMDAGRLVAHGSYEQMLRVCPQFKELCEIKFG